MRWSPHAVALPAPMGGCRARLSSIVIAAAVAASFPTPARATEGALGRPVSGTSVQPNAGIVPPEPIWAVNLAEIYLDGSIGGSRQVPIGNQLTLGVDAEASFTLATVLKVWNTGPGSWNFASSLTVPYIWERASANVIVGNRQGHVEDRTSNLFDLYFTPIIAGYHFSKTEHVALSFNVWAPTGKYDPGQLANPSLNTWTFVPQVAYTKILPEYGAELDATAAFLFYTKNTVTDYQNAPQFTLDLMALKRFDNGWAAGLIVGTVQQLGDDSGPTADLLNGFVGYDWAVGPIVTYDTKIDGKLPLSMSFRWVPTVSSKNHIDSTRTFMGSISLVF